MMWICFVFGVLCMLIAWAEQHNGEDGSPMAGIGAALIFAAVGIFFWSGP